MNCQQCFALLRESGSQPACYRNNCDIEEIATDVEANDIVEQFRRARIIYELNQVERLYIDALMSIGLLDEPELLMDLEVQYQAMRNKQRETAANKAKKK